MKRTKSGKRQKKGSVLLRVALLAFCIYVVWSLVSLQSTLMEKNKELTRLNQEIKTVSERNADIAQLLENGSESDFIERAARDKLDYVYANEEVYIDISGK